VAHPEDRIAVAHSAAAVVRRPRFHGFIVIFHLYQIGTPERDGAATAAAIRHDVRAQEVDVSVSYNVKKDLFLLVTFPLDFFNITIFVPA
jgi:hypothetical protein